MFSYQLLWPKKLHVWPSYHNSYWPNLKHTPSVLKLNIFLWVEPIIPENFLNFSQKLFDMHSTICLQFKIDVIEEILDNWSHEKYRITIESFRRMSDCLVLIKIGSWNEPNYFLKCGFQSNPHRWKVFHNYRILCFLFSIYNQHTLLCYRCTPSSFHPNLTQVSKYFFPHNIN